MGLETPARPRTVNVNFSLGVAILEAYVEIVCLHLISICCWLKSAAKIIGSSLPIKPLGICTSPLLAGINYVVIEPSLTVRAFQ